MEDFLLSTFDNIISPFEEWEKKAPHSFRMFMAILEMILTVGASVAGALLCLKLLGRL